MERDGITEQQAVLRMQAQLSEEYYTERAGYTIYNSGSYDELLAAARALFKEIF